MAKGSPNNQYNRLKSKNNNNKNKQTNKKTRHINIPGLKQAYFSRQGSCHIYPTLKWENRMISSANLHEYCQIKSNSNRKIFWESILASFNWMALQVVSFFWALRGSSVKWGNSTCYRGCKDWRAMSDTQPSCLLSMTASSLPMLVFRKPSG